MSQDGPYEDTDRVSSLDAQSLMDFAQLALREAPQQMPSAARQAPADLSEWLLRASLPGSAARLPDLRRMLSDFNITPAHAVDIWVPTTARRLGEMWLGDDLAFAEVSLATSRLMQLSRMLENENRFFERLHPRGLEVLVITAPEEQHLLGPQILTGQLRRRGHRVRFTPGVSDLDLDYLMDGTQFDAMLMSVGSWATLDSANALIAPILEAGAARGRPAPRVVLGGAIVAQEHDLKSRSPAHWITNDISAALDGLLPVQAEGPEQNMVRDT